MYMVHTLTSTQKLRQMKTQMDAKGIRVDDLPSDKKETYKYFLSVYVQVMAYQQKKAAAANGAQGKFSCPFTCPGVSFIADHPIRPTCFYSF